MDIMNPDKPADVSLIDGSSRRGREDKTMESKHCSTSRLWMILTLVFLGTSIALAAYVIYTKGFDKEEERDHKQTVVEKYRGYFRTVPEQESYALQYQSEVSEANATNVPQQNSTRYGFCYFTCNNNNMPARKKRFAPHRSPMAEFLSIYMTVHKLQKRAATPLGPQIFHGCCISRHNFISPDTATNAQGQTVTLVQLQDQRQYFPTQQCKHAEGCTGCGCAQETTLLRAVVRPVGSEEEDDDDDDESTLDFIRIPGCCKCFNGRSP